MRFKPDTFGLLVRPRILAVASILPQNTKTDDVSWIKPKKSERFNHLSLFNASPRDLFSSLRLGDTSTDISTAYTAVVTNYIVRFAGTTVLVDKHNVYEVLAKIRKRLGARTNLRVISVGVKFYHGMALEGDTLVPINPWNPKTSEGQEVIWFYNPWELVPIKDILKFESASPGDLILFQKCHGLVVKKKLLNKPKYYMTSSWSCYTITLLNHTADGFTRFLPDRVFEVKRPEEISD